MPNSDLTRRKVNRLAKYIEAKQPGAQENSLPCFGGWFFVFNCFQGFRIRCRFRIVFEFGLRVGLLLGLWVQFSRAHPRMIIPSLLHVMGSGFSGNLKRLGVRGLRFGRCLFIGPRYLGSYGSLVYPGHARCLVSTVL